MQVRFFIHCTNFLGLLKLFEHWKEVDKFILLESHGRVEDYNRKFFGKKKNYKVKKKEDENFQYFMQN